MKAITSDGIEYKYLVANYSDGSFKVVTYGDVEEEHYTAFAAGSDSNVPVIDFTPSPAEAYTSETPFKLTGSGINVNTGVDFVAATVVMNTENGTKRDVLVDGFSVISGHNRQFVTPINVGDSAPIQAYQGVVIQD